MRPQTAVLGRCVPLQTSIDPDPAHLIPESRENVSPLAFVSPKQTEPGRPWHLGPLRRDLRRAGVSCALQ